MGGQTAMKRFWHILLFAVLALSCVRELPDDPDFDGTSEADKVTVTFTVSDVKLTPATRALTEEGTLNTLYLAVFGSSGFLKEYVKAEKSDAPTGTKPYTYQDDQGQTHTVDMPVYSYTATLTSSSKSRIVHFIGNGPDRLEFGYEDSIMPSLLSQRGEQAFWQRKEIGNNILNDQDRANAAFSDIALIRNWAKIELVSDEGSQFTPKSYAVINVPSKGSVAPAYQYQDPVIGWNWTYVENYQNQSFTQLNENLGYPGCLPADATFDGTVPPAAEFETGYLEEGYRGVVSPANGDVYLYERPKASETIPPSFIIVYGTFFEHPEDTEDPGHDYYYKIDLMEGDQYFPIFRNFKYRIRIKAILSRGHDSPEAAAAAAGSADVSADVSTSHLNDISDGQARLVVQPWMSQSFIRRQVDNNVLSVKFFADVMQGTIGPVSYEIRPMENSGQDPVIKSVHIGSPTTQGTEEEKGWRTITFSTYDPGNEVRSQKLRIKGTYDGGELYRDIIITLLPLQQMALQCKLPELAKGIKEKQELYITIPDGLVESMFPLEFTVEPEDITLTPDNTHEGFNLPVTYGTSISDHARYSGKRTIQFKRTLTWDKYGSNELVEINGTQWRRDTCFFEATRRESATTIWVANEFFVKSQTSFDNPPAPLLKYFYVEALDEEGCTIQFNDKNVSYMINDNPWESNNEKPEIGLKEGDRVYFSGNKLDWSSQKVVHKGGGHYKVGGSIASLFMGDSFDGEGADDQGSTTTGVKLKQFFSGEVYLKDASELILPMTDLTTSAYESMFSGCTSLESAPALPATTLSNRCYESMFSGCTSLASAPALPALQLASRCYAFMFKDCSSLTVSPVLPARNLISECYIGMFSGCSSMNEISMLAENISASNCLNAWVTGVADAGTFHRADWMTSLPVGSASGIPPTYWVDSPWDELYVDALSAGSVKYTGSSALEYSLNWGEWAPYSSAIPVAAGDMVRFRGSRTDGAISSTGSFNVGGKVESLGTDWSGLFKDATTLVSAAALKIPTTLTAGCCQEMFSGCTALTTPPALPATTLAENCYNAMFQGCTNLTAAPKLLAEMLVTGCYAGMFSGCSNLSYVDCAAKTNLGDGYTTNWLASVAATGVFVKNKVASWTENDPSGIPVGWTVSTGDYFKIRAISTTMITFNYDYENDGIEYSLDEGANWEHYVSGSPFQMTNGQVAWIRGNRINYKNDSEVDQYGTPGDKPIFTADRKVYISGNIMSLLADKENLSESAFQGAFSRGSSTALTNIDIDPDADLILPATTMASQCYMQMFRNCTSLTKAPVFTVQSTAYRCCYNMFRQCSNLKDVSSIQLPAATLAEDCYRELFRQCTQLSSVDPNLFPAMTLAKACYRQMFSGCTKLTNAPILPATTLVEECYYQMFSDCSNLVYVKCLAETGINQNYSTHQWMNKVKSAGTFVKKSGITSWPTSVNGIPSGWTIVEEP